MITFRASSMQDAVCWFSSARISVLRTPCAQEAKDKEKKLKAAGGDGGAGAEELLLQISTLTKEEELRNFMQLERVGICKFLSPGSSRLEKEPLHEAVSALICLVICVH